MALCIVWKNNIPGWENNCDQQEHKGHLLILELVNKDEKA
jgi:hypothetical protein